MKHVSEMGLISEDVVVLDVRRLREDKKVVVPFGIWMLIFGFMIGFSAATVLWKEWIYG